MNTRSKKSGRKMWAGQETDKPSFVVDSKISRVIAIKFV